MRNGIFHKFVYFIKTILFKIVITAQVKFRKQAKSEPLKYFCCHFFISSLTMNGVQITYVKGGGCLFLRNKKTKVPNYERG